jgi:uncharacterized membrane protein
LLVLSLSSLFSSFYVRLLIIKNPIPLRIGFFIMGVNKLLNHILDFFGRAICHQLKERSLYVDGQPLTVCARDTGIYIGIFSTLSYLCLHKRRVTIPSKKISFLLLLFLIPLMFDGLGSYLHFFQSSNLRRLITGVLFGLILPYFLYPLISSTPKMEPVIKNKRDLLIPLCLSVLLGVIYFRVWLPYYFLNTLVIFTLIVWISLCTSFLFSFVKMSRIKWPLSVLTGLLFLSALSLFHEWVLKLA